MILVTGATGTVGGRVARRLLDRGPLRVLARRPERVAFAGPSAEVVPGDYGDRASLDAAMVGVRAAFLVTNDPQRPQEDADLLDAARAAGVRRVVKLSAHAVGQPGADDLITDWHRANEDRLRACGLDWTILRPRAFMTNTLSWASSIRTEGVVRAFDGESPNACVDPDDIAEVACRALTEPGHEGRVYSLTGPEALTVREQTDQLGEMLGRSLRFERLTADQFRAGLRRRYPEPVVEALMASAERGRSGSKAQVDPTVREVTGRPPKNFRAWAAENAERFN
ncbi:SDR family oxidoreductase [Streptomyces silvisoli]|uniref:SDR family oxidoreductase n=1 Tax=Streptomyces silvisoli TaxID=3034235 RepID=A0ABT5ZQS2_9ACTN|nr:SDR family oxidoreductase [Streptomyces silvisoli]MDF3291398.1 SDR family oxidoreductase [Streptomyces silvisoli]